MQIESCCIEFGNAKDSHAGDVYRTIKGVWPHARFEDVRCQGASYSEADETSTEFYVYRNTAAFRAVNKLGVEDFLRSEFVHVILDHGRDHAAVVVGDRGPGNEAILAALARGLDWVRLEYMRAAS